MGLRGAGLAVLAVVCSALDMSLTLLGIAWDGKVFSFANISNSFSTATPKEYDFRRNPIDFFVLSLLRITLYMVGAGLVICDPIEGVNRVRKVSGPVFGFTLLLWAFSPTKLLAFAEKDDPLHAGQWLCMAWNFVAALILHIVWNRVYGSTKTTTPTASSIAADRAALIANQHHAEGDEEAPIADVIVKAKETFELIARLLQYCRREWVWHMSGFTWLFLYSISRIVVPYYTGQVIATVVATRSYDNLLDSVKVMTVISVASAIFGGFRGGSFEYCYAKINRAIRGDLFTSLVHQEVGFYDANKTGEVTSRLTADCQTMSDTVALNVNVFLRNIVMMGGSMIFMFMLSWRLSLVTFIAVPIIFLASKIFGTYYDILSERTQDSVAKANDVAEEVLSTMRTVRSFACENVESDRYYGFLTITLGIVKVKAFAYIGFIWVNELCQMFILVAVLWFGGHLVITKRLQGDLLVSFLLYQLQLGDNLRQMGEVWTGLMQSVGASRKVFEYIDRKPAINNEGRVAPSNVAGKIEFRNVHFSYPSRPDLPILKDLSFSVNPGETVALVGPSGGGKSSCIALLEHFYEPSKGQVLIDGVPLQDFDHKYIHTKAILLLDEATSALDTESEHLVQEALYKNLKGRTVILIAHRLSTVEKADKIVVINKGCVEQEGTHQELLNQDGLYKNLVQRQMIGHNEAAEPVAAATFDYKREREELFEPTKPMSPVGMARSLLGTSFTGSGSSYQSH
uniref:ATP-binding cassette sub-family B member 9 n=1 Tax=Plectus sambesii TaxID=2011161 RepID=A0A914W7W3_9BILA